MGDNRGPTKPKHKLATAEIKDNTNEYQNPKSGK